MPWLLLVHPISLIDNHLLILKIVLDLYRLYLAIKLGYQLALWLLYASVSPNHNHFCLPLTLEVENSRSRSLDFIIVGDFAWIHLCDGGYLVHRKIMTSILGLYSMQVNSIPYPYLTSSEQINCLPFILQCLKVKVLVAQLCLTFCEPADYSHQAPLSMGFSRQEH